MATDNDCPSAVYNIIKARKKWEMLSWILRQEGAYAKMTGTFFKAVTQYALLFVSETWLVDICLCLALGILHK